MNTARLLHRLERRFPGSRSPGRGSGGALRGEGPLLARVAKREAAEARPERKLVGESTRIGGETTVKSLKPAMAGPNAPLLMRLVRHPFVLRVVAPVRVDDGRVPRGEAQRVERLSFSRFVRDRRADLAGSARPFRGVVHRPQPRPRLRASGARR